MADMQVEKVSKFPTFPSFPHLCHLILPRTATPNKCSRAGWWCPDARPLTSASCWHAFRARTPENPALLSLSPYSVILSLSLTHSLTLPSLPPLFCSCHPPTSNAMWSNVCPAPPTLSVAAPPCGQDRCGGKQEWCVVYPVTCCPSPL